MSRRLRSASRAAALLALAFACGGSPAASVAAAVEVPLYEVKVPLAGTSEADRKAGFAEALRLLAVRASGRSEAAASATIAAADPAQYVQRYSTSADRVLTVGFERRSADRLLQQAGLPLWPAERPLTRVEAPGADREAAERAAQRRGLPIEWGESGDARAPSDPARALLVGTPGAGAYDWSFSHAGQTARGAGSIAAGIDVAADTLAARYAPPAARSESSFVLRVSGIAGLGDYAGVLEYLGSLSFVRDVAVEALEGEVLRLRIAARGDRELLGRIAALDGTLQVPAADDRGGAGADLHYVP
jgi:hypothetical protein